MCWALGWWLMACHLLHPHTMSPGSCGQDQGRTSAGPHGLRAQRLTPESRSQSAGSLPPHRVTFHTSIPKAPHSPLFGSSSARSKVYRDQLACSQMAPPGLFLLPLPTPTDLPTSLRLSCWLQNSSRGRDSAGIIAAVRII